MTDAYTKAVLTVIALALVVLAVRPIIDPGRVDAQGPNVRGQSGREGTDAAFELLSRRVDKLGAQHRGHTLRGQHERTSDECTVLACRLGRRRRPRRRGRRRGDGRALRVRDPAVRAAEPVLIRGRGTRIEQRCATISSRRSSALE